LILLAVFVACASGGAAELRDREWKMVSTDGFASMPAGVETPMVRFDRDGRFSGSTGCNSVGAAYTVSGDEVTIRPLLMTKRACLNPDGRRLESAYAKAVENTRRFRIEKGQLELLSQDGAVLARFQ
jgi:heat shock protein HslJ